MIKHEQYVDLIKQNKQWAKKIKNLNKNYFKELSKGQKPHFLFFGCSDSRVPIHTITQAQPGDIFIQQNIANQINQSDNNCNSVLKYAVEYLKVGHIIICGHYNCGGIKAALEGIDSKTIDTWITPIKNLIKENHVVLSKIKSSQEKVDTLVELNVIYQLMNLIKTPIMTRVYKKKKYPLLHAWVFDMYTGLIKELDLPIKEWKKEKLLPAEYPESI